MKNTSEDKGIGCQHQNRQDDRPAGTEQRAAITGLKFSGDEAKDELPMSPAT